MKQILAFNILTVLVFSTNGMKSEQLWSKPPDALLIDDVRINIVKTFDGLWQKLAADGNVDGSTLSETLKKINENITRAESFINTSEYGSFSTNWSYAQIVEETKKLNAIYQNIVNAIAGVQREVAVAPPYKDCIKSMEKIHRYAATDVESENLFKTVNKEFPSSKCSIRQSPHIILYNLYNSVQLAELKGYIALQFSYMLLKLYNKGNFTVEVELARSLYEQRVKEKMQVVQKELSESDKSAFKCDPKQHVNGITYATLTELMQGYIENEKNFNPSGECWQTCAYYDYPRYFENHENDFSKSQGHCKGDILHCRFVDADMNLCLSTNPERRYDWVEYENGRVFGNKGVCENKNLFQVDSWWRFVFWHCSYCFCLCDDPLRGDRFFNLRNVVSDVANNRVITGIRILKNNRIIHLQIQQGTLMPRALIDKSSLSWKPVDNYSIFDEKVRRDVDYHTITWNERAIDIDEISAPAEHVVTGVRFRKIGTHLNLQIQVTPIDFVTGELHRPEYAYWIGNDNTDANDHNPRTEIKLKDPDIPIRNGPHSLYSKHDQFIQFQPSSVNTDVAQSTVPFIDSQAISSQGFPLSGIGLMHRGKLYSGGFIAPKIITYDYAPHLNSDILVL